MHIDAPLIDRKTLQQLEQIDNLSAASFAELAAKTHIENQPVGPRLFVRGREDQWVYYLLVGGGPARLSG